MARRQRAAVPSDSESEDHEASQSDSEQEAPAPAEAGMQESSALLQEVVSTQPASPTPGSAAAAAQQPSFRGPKRGSTSCMVATLVFSTVIVLLQWWTAVPLGQSGPPPCVVARTPVAVGASDPRSVSMIELCVGLKVLLVSDPAALMAGAAVDVHTGSLSDPPSFPGLAHMLEHSVFLGNARADETEFGRYLSTVGGFTNAYTDLEDTNYYFTSSAAGLSGGLARLAQFFIAPSLNASLLEREVHAVDSEHHKNLESDGWRQFQLLKHLASPRSPLNSFSTGDLTTLHKPGLRAALAAFHAKHYRAHNMAAVVIGPQALEALESLASRALNSVWRGDGVMPELPPPPPYTPPSDDEQEAAVVDPLPCWQASSSSSSSSFVGLEEPKACDPRAYFVSLLAAFRRSDLRLAGKEIDKRAAAVDDMSLASTFGVGSDLEVLAGVQATVSTGTLVFIKPVADTHEVAMYWPLPPCNTSDHSRVAAAEFLSALLGDEGEGSLLASLKAAGVAVAASAGLELDTNGFSVLALSFTLDPRIVASSAGAPVLDRLRAAAQLVQTAVTAYVRLVEGALEEDVARGWARLTDSEGGPSLASTSRVFVEGSVLTAASGAQEVVQELTGLADRGALLYAATAADAATIAKKQAGAQGAAAAATTGASRTADQLAAAIAGSGRGSIVSLAAHAPHAAGTAAAMRAANRGEALLSMAGNATASPLFGAWSDAGKMQEAAFTFPDAAADPSKLVAALARSLHRYGAPDIWGNPARRVWQPAVMLSLARRLRAEAAITFIVSSALPRSDLPSREPVYGSAYLQEPLGSWTSTLMKDNAAVWAQAAAALGAGLPPVMPPLALPAHNAFIPASFSLASHAPYAASLSLPEVAVPAAAAGQQQQQQQRAPPPPAMAVAVDDLLDAWLVAAGGASAGLHGLHGAARADATQHQESLLASLPVELWWQPDATYARPWARVAVHIEAPATLASPRASVLTSLLLALVRDASQTMSYPARKAGISFEASATTLDSGLTMVVEGYADSLQRAAAAYLPFLTAFKTSPEATRKVWEARLGAHVNALAQSLRNSRKEQPYVRAIYAHDAFVGARRFETDALMTALLQLVEAPAAGAEAAAGAGVAAAAAAGGADPTAPLPADAPLPAAVLTRAALYHASGDGTLALSAAVTARVLDALFAHATEAFASAVRLAVIVSGNVALAPARTLFDASVAQLLPLTTGLRARLVAPLPHPVPPPATAHLLSLHPPAPGSAPTTLRFAVDNTADVNSATVVAYHIGPRDACAAGTPAACYARDAAADVLATLIRDPAYETLRTQQQLGYIVFATPRAAEVAATPGALGAASVPAVVFTSAASSGRYEEGSARRATIQLQPLGDVWQSLVILAQGVAAPAPVMAARIAAFTTSFEGFLSGLSETEWEAAKAGTASRPARQPPATMADAADRQTAEILRRSYRGATRAADEAQALADLRKEDVLALFKEITAATPAASATGASAVIVSEAFGHPATR